jgi:hypothetical protein
MRLLFLRQLLPELILKGNDFAVRGIQLRYSFFATGETLDQLALCLNDLRFCVHATPPILLLRLQFLKLLIHHQSVLHRVLLDLL